MSCKPELERHMTLEATVLANPLRSKSNLKREATIKRPGV